MVYEWILANKELLKIAYALIICFICAIIVLRTDRLFKLSDYQGLRYLRNTFVFYFLAFFFRFIIGKIENPIPAYGQLYFQFINFLFEFFVVMAGFFLFYSLIWKSVEKGKNYHSVFNLKIGLLLLISLAVAILDFKFSTYLFMYISQIIIFLIMGIISFKNYLDGKNVFYFFMIVMGFISWVLNAYAFFFLRETSAVQISAYVINMIFFLFFLYGTIRITRK